MEQGYAGTESEMDGEGMTSDYIKMCVCCYFRYVRQFPVVALEYRHYLDTSGMGVPDVLVLDRERRPIEIEVKVSLSDFKADAKKHIWNFRNKGMRWPWKLFYAVPIDLEEKVKPLLRDGVGLLRIQPNELFDPSVAVSVAVTAPKHSDHAISEDRFNRIIAGQSASLCTALRKIEKAKRREAEEEI